VQEILLFNKFFFRLMIHALMAKLCDSAQMANFWRLLGPAFPARHVQHISDMQSKFALTPHHMGDIQSAMAENRR